MTTKQTTLFNHHKELATTFASAKRPVYWVLDLTDEVGFAIAVAIAGETQLAQQRESTLAAGSIPSYTLAADLPASNALLEARWGKPPLPFPSKSGRPPIQAAYMCLVADGRLLVAAVPSFHNSLEASLS